MRSRLVGGVPMNPKVIEGWLRSKAGITDQDELEAMILRTVEATGVEFDEDTPIDEVLDRVIEEQSKLKQVGFLRSPELGLYFESRNIMAALKEAITVRYPWPTAKWGPTKKTAKSWAAERFCVFPERIPLGKMDPDGIFPFTGHISGPQGKRSTLTNYQYVDDAVLDFELHVADDHEISDEQWRNIWIQVGMGGIGAVRSQQYGKCYVSRFDKRKRPKSSK